MSISGWLSGQLGKKHLELCKVLNIDRNIGNNIWIHFLQYYDEYLLEGDPFHWLGCCIYLRYPSCSVTPSSNKPIILNLTRLLRNTNLSLVNFFQKTKRWAEITGLGEADLVRFESLQRGFAVSMAIFKSYKSIFIDMIGDPSSDTKVMKSKRNNKFVPSIKKLFEFTWRLYISVKSSFPEVQNDLVHSYHLLLAACDFIFANAFLSKMDIINPKFPDYKNVITSTRYGSNSDIPCIIDILCRRHNGVPIQAKQVKEYFWKKMVKSFFDKKLLKGNIYLLSEIIGPNFLDINMKNIDRFYEDYILCLGVFDERLFLAESFFSELAGSNLQQKMDDISNQLESSSKFNYASSQGPSTPLSAKRFLKDSFSETNNTASPSSYSSMATLQSMLYSRSAEPSSYLQKVLKNVGDLNPSVETRVSDMAQIVYAHFTEPPAEHERWSDDLALSRVDISKKLYYRFLDKLIFREMSNPSFNCKLLFSQDIFHKTLFACAVEVVLFTFRSPWVFPWILETLHISAYHFSRIIEVVVRADELLSREMIKHLNWVEEIVLERLAWKSDSPLWKAIIDSNLPIPSCEDVSVRPPSAKIVESHSQDSGVDVGNSQSSISSQSGIDRLASLAGTESVLIESPGAPLSDKFQTPTQNCPLKRQADTSNDETNSKVIVISNDNDDNPSPEPIDNTDKEKARRTGAIALFFRKFYYLSSVRLQDMCDQLSLLDVKLRQKIWTSFELIIINYVNMMIDRHLDQILMCSIYVICKIVGPEQKFTDMMKCYRNQPQAQSSVYRNVLLGPERTLDDLKEQNSLKTCIRDTGDLIQFYNAVFLNKVEDLVRMFKFSSRDKERIVLSPIPYNSSLAQQSPRRRISDNHNVFIKYLSEKSENKSPNNPHFTYCITQSPMKSLKLINNVISVEVTRGKKLLPEDDSENIEKDYSCSPAMNKKVIDLLNDRRAAKNFSKE